MPVLHPLLARFQPDLYLLLSFILAVFSYFDSTVFIRYSISHVIGSK